MLQDDRHFVGIALQHGWRDDHARRLGLERDVEMMLAGKPPRAASPSTLRTTERSAS
jgi:hypothetical protein